jgi:hypothetical protein
VRASVTTITRRRHHACEKGFLFAANAANPSPAFP